MTPARESHKRLATNRKALRDYHVLERFEAGIALRGTEVKSARDGHLTLSGAYGRAEPDGITLHNMTIQPYEHGNRFNHEPDRPRRLLLHKREIERLRAHVEQKGCTLVPLNAYLKKGLVKLEIGLCRGKTHGDKRESMRRKTADREAARAIAERRRR
ncbi:SsrA-binding protein SmpB [Verrucomicrobiota bacterium]